MTDGRREAAAATTDFSSRPIKQANANRREAWASRRFAPSGKRAHARATLRRDQPPPPLPLGLATRVVDPEDPLLPPDAAAELPPEGVDPTLPVDDVP